MRAVVFVFVLAVMMRAQNGAAPSGDVTIKIEEGTPEYCLGSNPSVFEVSKRGADDITLRLPLKLLYENHRSETIYLPAWIHYLARMTVDGQNGSTILRNMGGGGMDVKTVMAMSRPDSRYFSIIVGGKGLWSTGFEGVVVPVLNRSSGWDLRGKTVQIVMTRDFRSLSPEVVEKLNEKWKEYGTVWAGVAESNTITFYIPKEPLTRNCMIPLPR